MRSTLKISHTVLLPVHPGLNSISVSQILEVTTMNLAEYPQAIRDAALVINDLEFQINRLRLLNEQTEALVEASVAFDLDLKNDNQRKAKKAELLMENGGYQDNLDALIDLTKCKSDVVAKLELLRSEFSCAKLNLRLLIADRLAGLESREIAGI